MPVLPEQLLNIQSGAEQIVMYEDLHNESNHFDVELYMCEPNGRCPTSLKVNAVGSKQYEEAEENDKKDVAYVLLSLDLSFQILLSLVLSVHVDYQIL